MLLQALCSISYPLVNSNWSYSPETPNLGQNRRFFSCVTFKLDRWPWKTIAHFFYAISSFVHYFVPIGEFRTGVTVRKRPIWVKIDDFFSRVTFKLDGWPWKTIGHLFYDTLSFVHHFNAIGKFKLKWKSRNAQFGSKSTIFFSRVT